MYLLTKAKLTRFQYALPCGSDSKKKNCFAVLSFNTHSLAGVIPGNLLYTILSGFNTHSLAGVIQYAITTSHIPWFQYALPCGSDSCMEHKRRICLGFNTHSLAGVILSSRAFARSSRFNTHSLAGVIQDSCCLLLFIVSIRTPLRE